MKKANLPISLISLVLMGLFVYGGMANQKPSDTYLDSENPDDFSIERAMSHIRVIGKDIHYIGSPYHKELQAYLVEELRTLGLAPKVHTNRVFELSSSSTIGATRENIVAKIKGSGTGKSLLVMAHYDSAAPHSLGASDAGSGVAIILEALRVFLEK